MSSRRTARRLPIGLKCVGFTSFTTHPLRCAVYGRGRVSGLREYPDVSSAASGTLADSPSHIGGKN